MKRKMLMFLCTLMLVVCLVFSGCGRSADNGDKGDNSGNTEQSGGTQDSDGNDGDEGKEENGENTEQSGGTQDSDDKKGNNGGNSGAHVPAEELEYTDMGDYYEVSGIGTVTESEITIPETYKGKPVTSIGSNVFKYCGFLTSVTIPESVTSIGIYGFIYGSGMALTRALTIYCVAASKPDGWHIWWNNGCPVVWDCKNNDVADDGNIYTVSNGLRYAIKDGSATVAIQPTNLSGDMTIQKSVTYNNNAYEVTSISRYAFARDYLTSLIIPDSVITIESMFEFYERCALTIYCEATSKPDGWDNYWNYSFNDPCPVVWDCRNNDVADDGNIYTVSNGLRYALKDGSATVATQLTNLSGDMTIQKSITYKNNIYKVTSIGKSAFSSCSGLISITIPDSVTAIGDGAFLWCSNLTIYCEAIAEPTGWVNSWNFHDRPVVWDCRNNDVADDGHIYTVVDGLRYALKDGSATVVTQPTNLSGDMTIQRSITYKNNIYKVTSIVKSAFYYCSSLTSITIPDGVTSIGEYAFYGCSSLTSITIPDGVTSIGKYTFYDCSSLASITIPDGVTSIGDYAFSGCSSLISITIPDGVTSIGEYAFYVCSSLTSIIIPYGVTSIGEYAFSGCSSLTSITIPDGVTSIGDYAFHNCISLTNITIPDGVTSIGEYAFYGCSSLTSIIIPDSVTFMGRAVFMDCSSLTIYCEATYKPTGWVNSWNFHDRPVVWGYKNEEDNL